MTWHHREDPRGGLIIEVENIRPTDHGEELYTQGPVLLGQLSALSAVCPSAEQLREQTRASSLRPLTCPPAAHRFQFDVGSPPPRRFFPAPGQPAPLGTSIHGVVRKWAMVPIACGGHPHTQVRRHKRHACVPRPGPLPGILVRHICIGPQGLTPVSKLSTGKALSGYPTVGISSK